MRLYNISIQRKDFAAVVFPQYYWFYMWTIKFHAYRCRVEGAIDIFVVLNNMFLLTKPFLWLWYLLGGNQYSTMNCHTAVLAFCTSDLPRYFKNRYKPMYIQLIAVLKVAYGI
jgi:hypothetical protein